jgi:hypothetical protein
MDYFLTMMMMSGLHGSERNAFLDRMLPTMLPLQGAQQQTVTALMAVQQVRKQARVEQRLVEEAVQAAKFTSADQLAPFPTLQQKFNSLSAAEKAKIFPPVTNSTGANTTAGPRKP